MAAAFAETSNDSCHDMQMTKDNVQVGANTAPETAEKSNVATAGSQRNALAATAQVTPVTATTPPVEASATANLSMASAIYAVTSANSEDEDDATMHTPIASPTRSFEGADELGASTATTSSDFGSGISTVATATTGSSSSPSNSSISSASNGGTPDQDSATATMPQWKKELIQRRKANIARTIGANQPGICSKKGAATTVTTTTNSSATMAAGGTAIGAGIVPTSPVLAIAKNFCNDSTFVRGGSGSSSNGIGVNNAGVNARTPDIIQHDASPGGHYTASSGYQHQHYQHQLPCVDSSASSSSQAAVSTPIFAKPKTSCTPGMCAGVSTGNDGSTSPGAGSGTKCTSGGMAAAATTTRGNGTCLTTSPLSESARLPFSARYSQQQLDSGVLEHQPSSIPSQLHSRLDVERPGDSSWSFSLSSSQSSSEPCNSAAAGTVSFVKNPYVNKSTNKFSKYKSSGAKSNGDPAHVHSVTPNVNSSNSANSLSVASAGNCGSGSNSRKMVAAQEPSDANDTFDDFDPTEELQYGPGIVSKLRCRYLSLALRQSTGKQRPALDNLRRATSLNNLLDDDDRGSNSSCATATDHSASTTHGSIRPSSENLGKSPDEFVATFQKNLKLSDKQRSRHVKRGNDSLKRARSVEALAVYGDKPWETEGTTVTSNGVPVQMRYSYMQRIEAPRPDISSISSSTEVTIEDKILSARERSSLIDKPPRKISPFMDEMERPPPDVVKQTLKIFEASANRRGRGLGRNNNCNGEVATKVRNYKSIISQEKPPIIFPKPPLSPKKNFRKPGTPPGTLDVVAAKKIGTNQQPSAVNNSSCNSVNNKKAYSAGTAGQIGSPITSIAKKFNSVSGEIAAAEPMTIVESQSPTTMIATTVESKISSPPVPSARTTIPFRLNAKNESTPIRNAPFSDGSHSPHTPDIIPRKIYDGGSNFLAAVDSPVSQLSKQIERLKIDSPTPPLYAAQLSAGILSPSLGTISPIVRSESKPKHSSESDLEPDEDDSCDGEAVSKQISKSALENISKAGTTQQFNFNNIKSSHMSSKSPLTPTSLMLAVNGSGNGATAAPQLTTIAKQVGVIRPLLAESKLQPQHSHQQTDSNKLKPCPPNNAIPAASDYTSTADHLVTAKARDNLVISNLSQQQLLLQQNATTNLVNSLSSKANNFFSSTTSNGNNKTPNEELSSSSSSSSPPLPATMLLVAQPPQRPTLTSREIEKNLINTKKIEEANLLEAANNSDNGVKWQFSKKKARSAAAAPQQQQQATQNTMIFNFKDRKEVPDYIENDGLLFRRKRELPKPNESGFVLLGDLSLETSTDPDDQWTMGPPSPCDVEFENANIVIDGKSSIRSKSKDISLRVQFNDTLTSTFEYPSETSMFDETPTPTTFDHMNSDSKMSHIVTATDTANVVSPKNGISATTTTTAITTEETIKSPGQKLLGSMSLGSAPLGSYIPMKAQINTHFELGVTRNPDTESSDELRQNIANSIASMKTSPSSAAGTTNGNASDSETTNGKANSARNSNGIDYMLNGSGCNSDDPESLQYLKPATDDLTVAYSEGTQKTDLLY